MLKNFSSLFDDNGMGWQQPESIWAFRRQSLSYLGDETFPFNVGTRTRLRGGRRAVAPGIGQNARVFSLF